MGKKLYVGNIPYSVTEADLRAMFETCGGVIQINLIIYKETGVSRGYAFIEMDSDKATDNAIAQLCDEVIGGRTLRISIASDRPDIKATIDAITVVGTQTWRVTGDSPEDAFKRFKAGEGDIIHEELEVQQLDGVSASVFLLEAPEDAPQPKPQSELFEAASNLAIWLEHSLGVDPAKCFQFRRLKEALTKDLS